MSQTKQQLTTLLLRLGSSKLGEVWDCSAAEVSRRINGERSISLDHFAKAMDLLHLKLVNIEETYIIPKDELIALNLLANRYLERRVNGEDDSPQ